MKTQKITQKLKNGEAMVVAPAKDLLDIANLFDFLSTVKEYSTDDRKVWTETAEHFRVWVEETEVDLENAS